MDVFDFRDLNSFSYITSFCRQQENSNQINSANAYLSTINNSIITDNSVIYNVITKKDEPTTIDL